MGVRSHVDPCAFVPFIHLRNDQLTGELAEVVRALRMTDQAPVEAVLQRMQLRSHQVLFHETYHYWQGLRLPYVFRYASLAFVRVHQIFMRLVREGGEDYEEWSCVVPELNRLDLEDQVGFSEGGRLFWGRADAQLAHHAQRIARLSPMDLLECAASLAEMQVTLVGQERCSPEAFRRWQKRNPAYLEAYAFVASFLEDEALALRVLLSLINASFHTTEPVRAFVELLGRVWSTFVQGGEDARRFLAQPEPVRWPELMQMFLGELDYEAPTNSSFMLLGTPFHRLTLAEEWVNGRLVVSEENDFLMHPILGPPARRWLQEERTHPGLRVALDLPGWVDGETVTLLHQEFSPPVTAIRFHMPDGADRTFLYGAGLSGNFTSLPKTGDENFRGFLADFLAMYGVVRRASGAHFDDEQRTCHHRDCPHYSANHCNAYPIVPEHYASCGFRARIERLIWHERQRQQERETPWAR